MTEQAALYAAIAKASAELGPVAKTQVSAGTGGSYKAFNVDKVYEAVGPVLHKHGLAIIPQTPDVTYVEHEGRKAGSIATTARYQGRWLIVHTDGGSVTMGFQADARDYADKSAIQAAQQAFKYALVQLFQIATGDRSAEEVPDEVVARVTGSVHRDEVSQPAAAGNPYDRELLQLFTPEQVEEAKKVLGYDDGKHMTKARFNAVLDQVNAS